MQNQKLSTPGLSHGRCITGLIQEGGGGVGMFFALNSSIV